MRIALDNMFQQQDLAKECCILAAIRLGRIWSRQWKKIPDTITITTQRTLNNFKPSKINWFAFTNYIKLVDWRILRLHNCERFGRERYHVQLERILFRLEICGFVYIFYMHRTISLYIFFSFPFTTYTTSPPFLYEAACSDMGLLMTAHRSNSRSSSFFLSCCQLARLPPRFFTSGCARALCPASPFPKNSSYAYSHFFFGGGSLQLLRRQRPAFFVVEGPAHDLV